ncbi:DUF4332 domain-containing protein [Flavivirga eckloniae]|uniref:DUF4332 domain-containing protein n=1 Tax=Flavivirga eckloniae TaxID=1803846 RepID=A0A2K9PLG9_9FLAO|nr:DUF4332 domain-containing protein [Flavivirga eckloniae]AUP77914.1 hypothetical protein C1H87_03980 [Flavivirga eckloniae]
MADELIPISQSEDKALTHFLNQTSFEILEKALLNQFEGNSEIIKKIYHNREEHGDFANLENLSRVLNDEELYTIKTALYPFVEMMAIEDGKSEALISLANNGVSTTSTSGSYPHSLKNKMRKARLEYGKDFKHPIEVYKMLSHSEKRELSAVINRNDYKENTAFPGFEEEENKRLHEIGIKNKEDMSAISGSVERKKKLAEASGIAETKISAWAPVAALMSVPAITKEIAMMLRDTGITTLKQLALSDPKVLYESVLFFAEVYKVEVFLEHVELWITAAQNILEASTDKIQNDTVHAQVLTGAMPELADVFQPEFPLYGPYLPQHIELWRNSEMSFNQNKVNTTPTWLRETPLIPFSFHTYQNNFGWWITGLPLIPLWYGPVRDSKEIAPEKKPVVVPDTEDDTPAKKASPMPPEAPVDNQPVPEDELTQEEEEIICGAIEHACKRKKEQDELEKKRLQDERERLEKEKKRVKEEEERRRRNPRYRDRRNRERDLRDRRKDLGERGDELENRRENLDKDKDRIQRDDQELREREQNIRKGPPADPNCRSTACRNVQTERVQNQQERYKNMNDFDDLARDSQKFSRDLKEYQDDASEFEDLMDRGYGQTESELKERNTAKEIRNQQGHINDMQERADQLDALDPPLTPEEERERQQLTDNIDKARTELNGGPLRDMLDATRAELEDVKSQLEDPNLDDQTRQNLEQKKTTLEAQEQAQDIDFTNAYKNSTEGHYVDLLHENTVGESFPSDRRLQDSAHENINRIRRIQSMSGSELDQYQDNLDKAINGYDTLIDQVGQPGNLPNSGNNAQDLVEQLNRDIANDSTHRDGLRLKIEGSREGIRNIRQRSAQIREELRRRGTSEHNTSVHGTPQEQQEILNMRNELRSLQNAEANLAKDIRQSAFRMDALQGQIEKNMDNLVLTNPMVGLEQNQEVVRDYNESLGDFFEDNGDINVLKARGFFKDTLRNLQRLEGLNQDADRLKAALNPSIENSLRVTGQENRRNNNIDERRQRLGRTEEQIEQTKTALGQSGMRVTGRRKITIEPNNPITGGLGDALNNHAKGLPPSQGARNAQQAQQVQQAQPVSHGTEKNRRNPKTHAPLSARQRRIRFLKRSIPTVEENISSIRTSATDQTYLEHLEEVLKGYQIELEQFENAEASATTVSNNNSNIETTTFVSSQITGLPFLLNPIVEMINQATEEVGNAAVQAFMVQQQQNQNDGNEKPAGTSTKLLKRLYVGQLIKEPWINRDWNKVVRMQARYAYALEELSDKSKTQNTVTASEKKKLELEAKKAQLVLAESYDNQADRATSAGYTSEGLVLRTQAIAARLSVQISEQKEPDFGQRVEDVCSQTDSALNDALDAGDCETAQRLLLSRIEVWNVILERLGKNKSSVSEKTHEKIAEDLRQLAHLYNHKANDPENTSQQEDLKSKARRAAMASAMHFIQSGDIFTAILVLESTDVSDDDQALAWKKSIIGQGLTVLDNIEKSGEVRSGYAPWLLKDRLLEQLANCSKDNETKAAAILARMDLQKKHGGHVFARQLFHQAKALDSDNPIIVRMDMKLLFEDEPEINDAFITSGISILERAPLSDTNAYDAIITASIFKGAPDQQQIQAYESAISQANISDERKSKIMVQVGMVLSYIMAKDPSQLANMQDKLNTIEGLIPTTTLTNGEIEDLRIEIQKLRDGVNIYEENKQKFQTQTLPAAEIPTLVGSAINVRDYALVEEAIKVYAQAGGIAPEMRIHQISDYIKLLENEARTLETGGDTQTATDIRERINRVRDLVRPISETTIQNIEVEIIACQSELRSATITLQDEQDEVVWPLIVRIGKLFAEVENEDLSKAVTNVESIQGKLHDLIGQARAVTNARAKAELIGLDDQARLQEIISLENEAIMNVTRLEAEAHTHAKQLSDDQNIEETYEELDRYRAQIALSDAIAETYSYWRITQQPYTETWDRYNRLYLTSAEAEVRSLTTSLNGKRNAYSGHYEIRGLRNEVERWSNARSLFAWTDDENQYEWRYTMMKDRLARTEERRTRLILSGPMIDHANGAPLTPEARLDFFVSTLDEDVRVRMSRANSLDNSIFEPLTNFAANERARATAIKAYCESVPELRSIKIIGETSGHSGTEISRQEYFRALAMALSELATERAYDFVKYVDTPIYKRGIVQLWNLHIAQIFREDPNGHSYNATKTRLQNYTQENRELSKALLDAAHNKNLSAEQRALLIELGFITETDEGGYELQTPTSLGLSSLDDELNLPTRSAWDELLNPWSVTKLIGTVLIPGGIASVTTRLAVGTALDGIVGGMVLRAAFESLVFTAVSHPIGYGMDWFSGDLRKDRPGFFEDYYHNLAIFLTLGAVGTAGQTVGSVLKMTQSKSLTAFYKMAAPALRMTTEATIFAGIEGVSSGEGLTLDAFLRNLMMVYMLHSGNKMGSKLMERALQSLGYNIPKHTGGLLPRRQQSIDPAREAAIDTLYTPAGRRLSNRDILEQKFENWADKSQVRNDLAKAGIELVPSSKPLPKGTRAAMEITADGRQRIHVDKNTTRADALNEVYKLHEIQRLGFLDKPFTIEMQAMVEFNSYSRMEREVYRDAPMSKRKQESIRFSLYWRARLNSIQSGRLPNRVLSQPGEGIVLSVTGSASVPSYRRRFLEITERTFDPGDPLVLQTLSKTARRAVERLSEKLDRRIKELINRTEVRYNAEERMAELEFQNDTTPDGIRRREETQEHINTIHEQQYRLELEMARLLDRMSAIVEGTIIIKNRKRRPTPDIRVQTPETPTHLRNNEGQYENIRSEYERISQENFDLKQELNTIDPSNVTRINEIESILNNNVTKLKNLSKEVGGLGAEAAIKEYLGPSAEVIFADQVGGGGAGEVDMVVAYRNAKGQVRFAVVEAKGGESKPGTANSAGFHAEQGTLAHTMITASKMELRAETLFAEGRLAEALRLRDTAHDIQRGFRDGTLDSFIVQTRWRIKETKVNTETRIDVQLRNTEVYKVQLRWTRGEGVTIGRTAPVEFILPEGTVPSASLRFARLNLANGREIVHRSDGTVVDLPSDVRMLMENLNNAKALVPSAAIIAMPRNAVSLILKEGTSVNDIINDPSLAHFREYANQMDAGLIFGIRIEMGANRVIEGAIYFGKNGEKMLIQKNSPNNSITIDGQLINIHVGTPRPDQISRDGGHVILADQPVSQLEQIIETLKSNTIGVNKIDPGGFRGIDTVDLPILPDVPILFE